MNKCVLITGGCRNSGLGIARKFAKEGYDVFLTSRSGEDAAATADALTREFGVFCHGYGFSPVVDHVVNEAAIAEMFDEIRRGGRLLDVLVLCAANLGIRQQIFVNPISDFSDVVMMNVVFNYAMAQAAAVQMREKGKGSIVFVNSNTAYRAIPDRIAYSASKGGVLSLSRALALDLGKYHIRSNCVLPGMIKTDRWENNINDCKNAPSNYTPLGDIADFSDIANAVWYFADDGSKNTTGAELVVDGGNMIQLYPIIPKE